MKPKASQYIALGGKSPGFKKVIVPDQCTASPTGAHWFVWSVVVELEYHHHEKAVCKHCGKVKMALCWRCDKEAVA